MRNRNDRKGALIHCFAIVRSHQGIKSPGRRLTPVLALRIFCRLEAPNAKRMD
jgi:hypothetical protein